jgi:hypothetical protein
VKSLIKANKNIIAIFTTLVLLLAALLIPRPVYLYKSTIGDRLHVDERYVSIWHREEMFTHTYDETENNITEMSFKVALNNFNVLKVTTHNADHDLVTNIKTIQIQEYIYYNATFLVQKSTT